MTFLNLKNCLHIHSYQSLVSLMGFTQEGEQVQETLDSYLPPRPYSGHQTCAGVAIFIRKAF